MSRGSRELRGGASAFAVFTNRQVATMPQNAVQDILSCMAFIAPVRENFHSLLAIRGLDLHNFFSEYWPRRLLKEGLLKGVGWVERWKISRILCTY